MNVSVVIPAYNEASRLRACLDALASQTSKPFEIIVVDNNSADNTVDVAASYRHVRMIAEPQQGRVFARNAGFRAARGDIIARIDADTVVPEDWIAHIQAYYANSSAHNTAWSGGAWLANMHARRFMSFAYNLLVFRVNTLFVGHPTLWGSNMAVRREHWERVADKVCLDNGVHEDLDLSIHLHRAGVRITYDHAMPVPVEFRRVYSDRNQLWSYLQMWPRTLRVHGFASWVFCWIVGALGLYIASFGPYVLDKILPTKR